MNNQDKKATLDVREDIIDSYCAIQKAWYIAMNFDDRYEIGHTVERNISKDEAELFRKNMYSEFSILRDYVTETCNLLENLLMKVEEVAAV